MRCKSMTMLVLLLGALPLAGHQGQLTGPVTEQELLERPAMVAGAPALSVDIAFMMAIDRSHTAGGAVILQGCDEPSKKVVRYGGNTLQEVLNKIVATDPDYKWKVTKGVVNLLPIKGVPELLTLRIGAFDTGDATDLATAKTFLFALPEVRKRSVELGFECAGINRSEAEDERALRERNSEPLGLEFCTGAPRGIQ